MLHRRGIVLWTLGRNPAALDDFRRAISVLQRADDQVWTARALDGRGLVYLAVGSPGRADADFVAAGRLFAETGQELEAVHTVLNRGVAASRSGDLPAALSFFDEAASRYRALNVPTPDLSLDRCDVLLAAGLTSEALAEADAAIRDIEQAHGWSTKKAELLLTAANCALAAAQPQGALDRAQAAYRLFRSQQNAWGQAHARLVLVQARYAVGPVSARLLRAANEAAERLEELGSSEATQAHLLAGRVALDLGRRADADRHLGAAARSRRRGPAMARASGWLAEALRAEAAARAAPDARGLPPGARGPGRPPVDPRRVGVAGPGHRAGRGTGGARPAARRSRSPSAAAALLDRALAGHRADRAVGAAVRRRGTQRRPGRAARGDQSAGGGPAGGHADRAAAAGAASARGRGARPLAAGAGRGRGRPCRDRRRRAARSARRGAACRDRRRRRHAARARLRGRAGAAVHGRPHRGRGPRRRLRAVRAAPAGPRAGRGQRGQRTGHPQRGRTGAAGRDPRPGRRAAR